MGIEESELLFYDSSCGLCNGFAAFVRRRDPDERLFLLRPLDGEDWLRVVPDEQRVDLPDSAVVRLPSGELLVEWTMTRYVLRRLGGLWRVFSWLMAMVPRAVGQGIYRFIARRRGRLACRL